MMRLLNCLCVAVLAAHASLGGIPTMADSVSPSSKKVGSIHIEEFGAYNVAAEISWKAQVVIGVDAIQPKEEPTIVLDFPGGTVADLLNTFVSLAPDYAWEETGGVIHVFRRNAHVSLLDVPMSYPGAIKKTRKEIWTDIAQRPEVSLWMKSNSCVRGELFNGKEFREHNDPVSIESGSLTVAQLLDDVAVKSGVDYWAVLQAPPNKPCRLDIILW